MCLISKSKREAPLRPVTPPPTTVIIIMIKITVIIMIITVIIMITVTVITVFSSSLTVLPDLTSAAVISAGFRGRSRIPLIKQKLQSSAD